MENLHRSLSRFLDFLALEAGPWLTEAVRQRLTFVRENILHPLLEQLTRSLIRISAFLRKEIFEVLRQPMLVFSLVLGPFLILLLFGVGYQNTARVLRTVVVLDASSPLAARVEEYATTLGRQLDFRGITDYETAQTMLRTGQVDIVTVVPDAPYNALINNQQAIFTLYHREIDPLRTSYIRLFGRIYVDEINRRVLSGVTEQGQSQMGEAQVRLGTARESARLLQVLLEECSRSLSSSGCDTDSARQRITQLDQEIDAVNGVINDNLRLVAVLEEELGRETPLEDPQIDLQQTVDNLIHNSNDLLAVSDDVDAYVSQLSVVADLQDDLTQLEGRLAEFSALDPRIIVAPFASQTENIEQASRPIDFFAPAVIVLLLQHLTVTFAALSMVREHQLGTMELFFVAPLTAFETLIGKYLSYLLFGGIIGLILLILLTFALAVPLFGNPLAVLMTLLAVVFTSLGIGFVISLSSKTDTQAVQYSMIVLLMSVFFTGFMLDLETLDETVRPVSLALPATYGIQILRAVMLRGNPLDGTLLLQLILFGTALFLVAWFMLRRNMSHS